MGTARTSPKVVRERRAKGISSNRGKVKRHFPKAHRNDRRLESVARDAKVWEPSTEIERMIARLIALRPPSPDLREEVEQELWVRLLGGETEAEIRESWDGVVKQAKETSGHLSLNAPLSESGEGALTMADMVDTEGVYHRSRGRVVPKKPMARCDCGRPRSAAALRCRRCVQEQAAQRIEAQPRCGCGNPCAENAARCRACVQEEAAQRWADHREHVALRIAERELQREIRRAGEDEKRRARRIEITQKRMARLAELAERRATYEAKRAEFLAERTCECGGYRTLGAARCLDCWRKDSGLVAVEDLPSASHLGLRHRPETRQKMSLALARNWQGEYGEQRRAALNVEQMICRKCGFDGPLEHFARNPNAYQGRDKICKPCMVKQTREYKQRHKQMRVVA